MKKIIDLTGKIINNIKIISFKERKNNYTYWNCQCFCGKEFFVRGSSLKNGNTKSCGCLKNISKNTKINKYEQLDNYVVFYTNKNEKFYCDKEDLEKIKTFCWYKDKDGYIVTSGKKINNIKQKAMYLHRFIMNINDSNLIIDHIDRNPLNNKKENLRIATKSENSCNTDIRRNNSSGFTGVQKIGNNWRAFISKNKKTIYLGIFKEKLDAINARLEAEKIYHKEFSSQNIK